MIEPMLSAYDTGARCGPRLWQPNAAAVAAAMQDGEIDDIGNVDFDDEEGDTVGIVHVERDDKGQFTVRVISLCGDDEIRVELHREKDTVVIEPGFDQPA